jgi:hypothetical protein
MTKGIVYCLTNSSFKKGIYKIGKTKFINDPYKKRVDALYKGATGVPTPFKIKLAISTNNIDIAEKTVHAILDNYRINEKREFFEVKNIDIIKRAFDTIGGTYVDYIDRKENKKEKDTTNPNTDVYLVEAILGHTNSCKNGCLKKAKYEVKWVGYEETTWEPYKNVKNLDIYKKYVDGLSNSMICSK